MKKAITWLERNGVGYYFHDYKKENISEAKLEEWLQHFDMWQLINTKGTTWKQLPDEVKESIKDKASAIHLMMEKTSLIKRPLVEMNEGHLLGFQESEWSKTFSK